MRTLAEPTGEDRDAQEWSAIERLSRPSGIIGMVGDSAPMQAVYGVIERFAPHQINALTLGESGSGNELVSHALHRLGPFAAGPFISFNCAA
jgi:DNA-binding NtrC family response regulator